MSADPKPRLLFVVLVPDRTYSVNGKQISFSSKGGRRAYCL